MVCLVESMNGFFRQFHVTYVDVVSNLLHSPLTQLLSLHVLLLKKSIRQHLKFLLADGINYKCHTQTVWICVQSICIIWIPKGMRWYKIHQHTKKMQQKSKYLGLLHMPLQFTEFLHADNEENNLKLMVDCCSHFPQLVQLSAAVLLNSRLQVSLSKTSHMGS